jgi:hypothetical protein
VSLAPTLRREAPTRPQPRTRMRSAAVGDENEAEGRTKARKSGDEAAASQCLVIWMGSHDQNPSALSNSRQDLGFHGDISGRHAPSVNAVAISHSALSGFGWRK